MRVLVSLLCVSVCSLLYSAAEGEFTQEVFAREELMGIARDELLSYLQVDTRSIPSDEIKESIAGYVWYGALNFEGGDCILHSAVSTLYQPLLKVQAMLACGHPVTKRIFVKKGAGYIPDQSAMHRVNKHVRRKGLTEEHYQDLIRAGFYLDGWTDAVAGLLGMRYKTNVDYVEGFLAARSQIAKLFIKNKADLKTRCARVIDVHKLDCSVLPKILQEQVHDAIEYINPHFKLYDKQKEEINKDVEAFRFKPPQAQGEK